MVPRGGQFSLELPDEELPYIFLFPEQSLPTNLLVDLQKKVVLFRFASLDDDQRETASDFYPHKTTKVEVEVDKVVSSLLTTRVYIRKEIVLKLKVCSESDVSVDSRPLDDSNSTVLLRHGGASRRRRTCYDGAACGINARSLDKNDSTVVHFMEALEARYSPSLTRLFVPAPG